MAVRFCIIIAALLLSCKTTSTSTKVLVSGRLVTKTISERVADLENQVYKLDPSYFDIDTVTKTMTLKKGLVLRGGLVVYGGIWALKDSLRPHDGDDTLKPDGVDTPIFNKSGKRLN